MRRRAVKGVEEEAAEMFAQGWWELGTCCLGVCVSSMRDREAQVSCTMAVVDCTRLSGGCRFVVSSDVQLQRCVYGRLLLMVQYYLRKGWAGSQTRVDSTVYVGDRRHDGGGPARLLCE